MGYIYRITNTIDGKIYIGQSKCDDIERRWKQHKKVDMNYIGPYLFNAYMKHGIDKFKFEIVCICFDSDCDKYEKEYILKFNTLTPNGYNIRFGPTFSKHTEDSKEIIRQKLKDRYKTDETMRKNLSLRLNKGIPISDTHKEKLSYSNKKYWENMSDEKYKELCDKRKENYKRIRNMKVVNYNTTGLLHGHKVLQKRVGKYDLNDNLIESYDSISDASVKNSIIHSSISKVCRNIGSYHTAGGFKWKFI